MAETNLFSDRLREPLNETTRKTRRNLLAAGVIGLVITRGGLIPEKISAFGIDFTSANQQALVWLLLMAIGYFLVSFIVYVYSELTAWQVAFTSQQLLHLREEAERKKNVFPGLETKDEYTDFGRNVFFRTKPTFYVRLVVELVIPVLFALYSAYTLYQFSPT